MGSWALPLVTSPDMVSTQLPIWPRPFQPASLGLTETQPDVVLGRLNQVVTVFEGDTIITALYGILDPHQRSWTYAAAGHPPVVVRDTDGTTRLLDEPNDPPLGVALAFHARQVKLEAGATLVLYTDGLIKRRAEPITTGFERLLDACSNGPAEPAALCDYLLNEMLGDQMNQDDVALLAVTLA